MAKVSSEINSLFKSEIKFAAKWLLVVTWKDLSYNGDKQYITYAARNQVIIQTMCVTSIWYSLAIYIYIFMS